MPQKTGLFTGDYTFDEMVRQNKVECKSIRTVAVSRNWLLDLFDLCRGKSRSLVIPGHGRRSNASRAIPAQCENCSKEATQVAKSGKTYIPCCDDVTCKTRAGNIAWQSDMGAWISQVWI